MCAKFAGWVQGLLAGFWAGLGFVGDALDLAGLRFAHPLLSEYSLIFLQELWKQVPQMDCEIVRSCNPLGPTWCKILGNPAHPKLDLISKNLRSDYSGGFLHMTHGF